MTGFWILLVAIVIGLGVVSSLVVLGMRHALEVTRDEMTRKGYAPFQIGLVYRLLGPFAPALARRLRDKSAR